MKLYFAVGANWEAYKALKEVGGKRMLISFAYVPKSVLNGETTFYKWYGENIQVLIDSGAYSVKHAGKEIDINAYIRFLHRWNFENYINLDIIGSWERSLKNQKEMESRGLNPIPVWHMGEPFTLLTDYVGSYKYVAIGFRKGASSAERAQLASTIFDQYPRTKFHMLAITQPEVLINHPFYSADSSTWLNSIKYGALLTPWGYIHVSRRRGKTKRHVLNMSRVERIKWESYFEGMGFKIEDLLSDDYRIRAAYSAKYFLALEAAINANPVPPKKKRMLDSFFKTVQRLKRLIM